MEITNIYHNGTYLANNKDWGAADAAIKAGWIKTLIDKNSLQAELKSVADIGTGSGGILKELSEIYTSVQQWKGFDIALEAIELAKKHQNNKLRFYNENFLQTTYRMDCLLIIDVVEHVSDYYYFLEQLRGKSSYYIFHIPLDLSCRTLLKPHVMKQQRQAVGHIHYFSKEIVYWMLEDTGYSIQDWFYTKPLLDITPQDTLKNKVKKTLRNTSFSINQHRSATLWGGYSMMILAK